MRSLLWTAVFLLDREDGRRPGPGCLLMAIAVVAAAIAIQAAVGR